MSYDLKNTLAVNLQHLMDESADMGSQLALSKRSGVGQTTIGNYLRPDSYAGSPSMKHLEKQARALGVDTWMLIHPTLGANLLSDREMETYKKIRRVFESK